MQKIAQIVNAVNNSMGKFVEKVACLLASLPVLTIAGVLRHAERILFVPCVRPLQKARARVNRWGRPSPPPSKDCNPRKAQS